MRSQQLHVLTKLLAGAVDEREAAATLDLPIAEIVRLKRAVASDGYALLPVAADLATGSVELLDLAQADFREPFLHESIDRARQERASALNLEVAFEDFVAAADRYTASPDGMIFHVGRCGSTLLANMLSGSGEHLLLKEPDVVNQLLAAWLHTDDATARRELEGVLHAAVRYLVGAAGAAAEARTHTVCRPILKLAAWNVRLAELLLTQFPSTPALFLYRSPLSTVASLLFQAPAWFGLSQRPREIQRRFFPSLDTLDANLPVSAVGLLAHAWRSSVEAALSIAPERMLLLDYDALVRDSADALGRVAAHFRYECDPKRLTEMLAARHTYSKDPAGRASFQPQGEHRRPELTAEQGQEVLAIVGDTWMRLEERSHR